MKKRKITRTRRHGQLKSADFKALQQKLRTMAQPVSSVVPPPGDRNRSRADIRHDAAVKAAATKRLRAGLPPRPAALSTATPPPKGINPSRRKVPAPAAPAPSEADTSRR